MELTARTTDPGNAEPQLGQGAAPVIPPGYKQTEIGVIPQDWEISKIGDFAFVTKLAGFEYTSHFNYAKSGPIIAIRALNIKDGALDLEDVHTIPQETSDALPRSRLSQGDLVMSYVGTLGRVAVISEDDRYHLAPNVAKISVNPKEVDPFFLSQFLNGSQGQRNILNAAASTTQAALSMRNLRKIVFVRPTLAEQQSIAAALGDADAYIDALAQRIAKQRLVKQGAMQALLTGKRRLPGFAGEWDTLKLRDLLSYERPDTYIVHNTEYSVHGEVPVLTANKAFILGYTSEDFGICSEIPVIVFDDFTTDCKYVDFPFKVKSSAIKLLRPKHDRVSLRFLFERMQLIRLPLGDHKRYYISEYQNLDLSVPGFAEQTAIAGVLSDMDAAIEALEAKLAKARLVKQGMMQELLTGKTRLV